MPSLSLKPHCPTPGPARRAPAWLVVLALLLCASCDSWAQQATPKWANEYQLKAVFVYKLISFVDWPAGTIGSRVIVGFAGEGPMAAALAAVVHGRRLGTVPIEVRQVHSQTEMRACNVLIVAFPDHSRTREALLHVRNTSVLTIGDGESFARMGGVIALVPSENTFQIGVNSRAAERGRLKISAKLLALAKLLPDEDGWPR
jgi:hypothetical protein